MDGTLVLKSVVKQKKIALIHSIVNGIHELLILAIGLFLYPQKTWNLVMLSGGIKRDIWHEMGY